MNGKIEDSELISAGTRRNWLRFGVAPSERLSSRANKTRSSRRVEPVEYASGRRVIFELEALIAAAHARGLGRRDLLFAVAVNLLARAGLLRRRHVLAVLEEYEPGLIRDAELERAELPRGEFDLPGLIYQLLLSEGDKNRFGSYYTPKRVISALYLDLPFCGKTLLDPGCGSGAFLLASRVADPRKIFGVDCDAEAVFLARVNLLLKYPNCSFRPQIEVGDFTLGLPPNFPERFELAVGNPPWGAVADGKCDAETNSNESSVRFLVAAFRRLVPGGRLRMLLPEAVLNVKIHRPVRDFLLRECRLEKIGVFPSLFSGVTTGFAAVAATAAPPKRGFWFQDKDRSAVWMTSASVAANPGHNLRRISSSERILLRAVAARGRFSLKNSVWGLGIVTGGNCRHLLTEPIPGSEPILTGREVRACRLLSPARFIVWERGAFQQAAPEAVYRAPEKLVYKFVSDRPVFALDDQSRLVLNSANVLIPNVPGWSIRSVMALLNSDLFAWLYRCWFGGVKILRGELETLPFPAISPETDRELAALACLVASNGSEAGVASEKIQLAVEKIFGLDGGSGGRLPLLWHEIHC